MSAELSVGTLESWLSHHFECPAVTVYGPSGEPCRCAELNAAEDDRWKRADELNERSDTCWANLATWALGRSDADGIFDQSICFGGIGADGTENTCYCGKLRKDRLPREGAKEEG